MPKHGSKDKPHGTLPPPMPAMPVRKKGKSKGKGKK